MAYTYTWFFGGQGTGANCSLANAGCIANGMTATFATAQGTNGGPTANVVGAGVISATDSGQQYGTGHNCVRLSAGGAGFTGAIVGELVNVNFDATYTDGRYVIVGISGTSIDIDITYSADAAASSAYCGGALAGTGGDGVFTGCLETVDGLLSSGDTLLIPTETSTQRTYTETNTCTIGAATAGATINIKGVANDGTEITPVREAESAGGIANGALTTTQFPLVSFANDKHLVVADYNEIKNLYFSGDEDATDSIVHGPASNNVVLQNCIVTNSGTGYVVRVNNYSLIVNCDITATANDHTYYCVSNGELCTVIHSRITSAGDSGTVDGLLLSSTCPNIINNVFYNLEGGVAIKDIAAGVYLGRIIGNTFYNIAGTCIATSNAASNRLLIVTDNLAVSCTTFMDNTYGATGDQHLFASHNAFYDCATKFTADEWFGISGDTNTNQGNIDLAADPFVDAAGGDFNLENSADTRTYLIGKSCFGTDIGALSHDPDYPAVTNVLEADTVNGTTGTYHAPDEDEVVSTAVFGAASAQSGDYVSPDTTIVKDGEFYGPDSSYEGEYAGGGGGGLLQGNKRGNKQ